jgi:nicotinate-nucleotide adenylyltransferase
VSSGAALSPSLRVGVLGGTFDPVHHAHLKMAQLFANRLALTEIRFVPAGHPWQKPALATPPEVRVAMLHAALDGFALRHSIDERELQRAGASYSVDTLRELREELGAGALIVFLMGSDQLARLHTWSRWQELFKFASLGVVLRAGAAFDAALLDKTVVRELEGRRVADSALPGSLNRASGQIALIEGNLGSVSSTQVREAARGGDYDTLDVLVPSAVRDYLRAHHLYRD